MHYVFRKKYLAALAFCLDLVGYAFFGILNRKKKRVAHSQNILIVRLDHLGDVLTASALPEILKKHFGARITFLTSSLGASLLENNPFVDEILVYDAPWFSRSRLTRSRRCGGFWDLARELKKRRYDLALAPRGDLRENFLLWISSIPVRVGYGITGGGFFLNHEIFYRFGAHETEHTADLLRLLGVESAAMAPRIYFSDAEEKILPEKLARRGIGEHDPQVGFQIDAGAPSKEWPEESMKAFLKEFVIGEPRLRMALVGTDEGRAVRLMEYLEKENLSGSFLNLVRKTSPRELFFLIRNLKAFVGPDSGPTHVAASLGVPTLFLYSGTNVFEGWKSRAAAASFLRHPTPCTPCFLNRCAVPGHPCMSGIQPQAVHHRLRQLLVDEPKK